MSRVLLSIALLISTCAFAGCQAIDRPYQPLSHQLGYDRVFGSCDSCSTCGGDCGGHTPGSYLGHCLTCASGCGEFYWGEWFSDPPDPCDPCDDCGNWIGERCCPPTWKERMQSGISGERFAGYSKSGCDCGGKGCAACDSEWMDAPHSTHLEQPANEVIAPGPIPAVRQPAPRAEPAPTAPTPDITPLPNAPAPPSEEATPTRTERPRTGMLPPPLRPRQTSTTNNSFSNRLLRFAR